MVRRDPGQTRAATPEERQEALVRAAEQSLERDGIRALSADRAVMQAAMKKPLLILPKPLREPALRVWVCHRHLAGMESPLAVASAVAVWTAEFGLHPDDAAEAMRLATAPERMRGHKFASDLMATIAEVADELRDRRATADAMIRRREEAERAAREAVEVPVADLVASVTADIGQMD